MVGLITHIQKFSIHDGPGIRTSVFLQGCPLSCSWCQNPEAMSNKNEVQFHREQCIGCKTCIDVCPKGCFSWNGKTIFNSENCNQCGICIEHCPVNTLRLSSINISAAEIIRMILKDRVYYRLSGGGITLSGGEPLQQADFCFDLLRKVKNHGINSAIDTSGFAPTQVLKRIIPLVDIFLFDIKYIDPLQHKKYTKVSNTLILENFRQICMSGKRVIVRIPLIPGYTDSEKNIASIEKFVKQLQGSIEIEKIPFNPLMEKKYTMLGKPCNIMERIKNGL